MIESNLLQTIEAVILAGFTIHCVNYIKEWRRKIHLLEKLPGPTPLSPWLYHLGNILKCPPIPHQNRVHSWSFVVESAKLYHNTSGGFYFCIFSPYRLPFLSRSSVLLTDELLIKKAVNHPKLQSKGVTYDTASVLSENSVLVATGHDWKRMRKLSSKAFSTDTMVRMTEETRRMMTEKVYPILDNSGKNQEEIDVCSLTMRLTLDVLGMVAFSYNVGGLDELVVECAARKNTEASTSSWKTTEGGFGDDKLTSMMKTGKKDKSLHRVFEEILEDLQKCHRLGPLQIIFKMFSRRYRKNVQQLNNTVLSVVESRRKMAKNDAHAPANENEVNNKHKKKDLLNNLLDEDENGEPILSTDELVGNTKTFLFAGHDTTSAILTFALYELSRKPHVLEKLRKEIDPLFQNNPNSPTYYQLRTCDYLEAVLRETLRLHPPVVYSRSTGTSEVILETPKHLWTIPKWTEIVISPWITHRMDTNDDPLIFDPDRALKDTDPYFPFAMDARNCVGREMAMAEMRAVIAHIVFDYEFDDPDEEVVTFSRMTLNPNRCIMKFRRRSAANIAVGR